MYCLKISIVLGIAVIVSKRANHIYMIDLLASKVRFIKQTEGTQ